MLSCKNKPPNDKKKYNAVTHVAVDLDTENMPKIIYGYYTLSTYSLERELLPNVDAKKTAPKEKIPALKLGRIARNKLFTKPGFGEVILMDVFRRAISLATELGFYLIEVDILNENVSGFYEKYGFKAFEDDQKHMFITMQTVKKFFDSKDPYLPFAARYTPKPAVNNPPSDQQ